MTRPFNLGQAPKDGILVFPDTPPVPTAGYYLGVTSIDAQNRIILGWVNIGTQFLPIAGGTLSGPLILARDPTATMEAVTKRYADSTFIARAGGTMLGSLTLAADPTQPLHAASKQYSDLNLARAGGTMTGNLFLNTDPSAPTQAATKAYVDSQISTGTGAYLPLAGGTVTGPLTTYGGATITQLDPRIPDIALAWQDTNGNVAAYLDMLAALHAPAVYVAADPTQPLQLATKRYVDAQINPTPFLPLAGGTLSGPLTDVGGSTIGQLDPRYPGVAFTWQDAAGNVGAAIDPLGALIWPVIRTTTLTATAATIASLALSGSLAVQALVVGADTFGIIDPRVPVLAFSLQDAAGNAMAGLDTNGVWLTKSVQADSVTLNVDPTLPGHALRKAYADVNYIPASGGTMTGPLTLPANPSTNLQAATKQYVDSAAAAGGGGGLAGLTAQRDYPTPPMRDPKRDYGAIGDGTTDDSAAVNACVAAAVAAGERLMAINDPFNVPSLSVAAANLIFVGTGSLKNNQVWKTVIPPFAPPPSAPVSTFIMRKHCPLFSATMSSTNAGTAIIVGDSNATPSYAVLTNQSGLWARLRRAVDLANPGKTITWHDRAIGGQTWVNLDTVPTSFNAWYTDHLRPWLAYLQDLNPDIVFINFSSNDSGTFRYQAMLSVMAKMRAWAKVPDIVVITSFAKGQSYSPSPSAAQAQTDGDAYCAGFERSYCLAHRMGLIDTARHLNKHCHGFDIDDIPMMRDTAPTGGYVTAISPIPLPYTWPTRCFGYGGNFYVPAAQWAVLGNEIQFELSLPTPSYNAGNLFRVGKDAGTGNLYYQVDTTLTSFGADQTDIFIPKTVVAGWPADNAQFQLVVSGSQVLFTAGGTLSNHVLPFVGPVPRFGAPWQPKITCTNGSVAAGLQWDRGVDGYLLAVSANPHPRAAFMPTMTDYEAHGTTATPNTAPWGGDGTAHASSLLGMLGIQPVLDACDFATT